jgi:hypothetical protein
MTETETIHKPELKLEEETTPRSKFKIETEDDLRRVMIIAKGGDPDAIQAVANFMDLKSNPERSYFPDKTTSLCVGQLMGFGNAFYPNDEWDPFSLVADVISESFMGYKGFKSNQFVEMTRQTPTLADIQTLAEPSQLGLVDRLLNRGKSE